MDSTPPGHSVNKGTRWEDQEEVDEGSPSLRLQYPRANPGDPDPREDLPSKKDMWAFMQSLPTRADIEKMLNSKFDSHRVYMESMVKLETQSLKEEMGKMAQKLSDLESQLRSTQAKLEEIESSSEGAHNNILALSFKVLDLENRSRRSNIRIRGLSETVSNDDLQKETKIILNHSLDATPDSELKIDRVHRVPPGRPRNQDRPRDVLCCLHQYDQKEKIMKSAWDRGPLEHKGSQIHLLQDLSPKTLALRQALKPLLEAA